MPSMVRPAEVVVGTNFVATASSPGWTGKIHRFQGNVLLCDGSVEQFYSSARLRNPAPQLRRQDPDPRPEHVALSLICSGPLINGLERHVEIQGGQAQRSSLRTVAGLPCPEPTPHKDDMELTEELKRAPRKTGADLVGVAALGPFKAEPSILPPHVLERFTNAVSNRGSSG